jgi:hypothetical protein
LAGPIALGRASTKTFQLDTLNNGEAVWRSDFSQYVMHVVFHRLLRQVQSGRNFLVGEPLMQQCHQFALSSAQNPA